MVRLFFCPFAPLNVKLSLYIMGTGKNGDVYDRKNHLYGDSQERSLILHSLVELKKPTHTAEPIWGLRGRTDIQSSKRPCKENEN